MTGRPTWTVLRYTKPSGWWALVASFAAILALTKIVGAMGPIGVFYSLVVAGGYWELRSWLGRPDDKAS